jgi:hypothetical protein
MFTKAGITELHGGCTSYSTFCCAMSRPCRIICSTSRFQDSVKCNLTLRWQSVRWTGEVNFGVLLLSNCMS